MDAIIGEEDRHNGVSGEEELSKVNKRQGWFARFRDRTHAGIARLRKWVLRFPNAKPVPEIGRDADIIKLIACLHEIRDIPAKELEGDAGIWVHRATKFLWAVAIVALLTILTVIVVFFYFKDYPLFPQILLWSFIVFLASTFLSLVASNISMLLFIVFVRDFDFHIRRLELAHDLRMAAELRQFDVGTLKAGEQWLGLMLERLKFRLVLMFGGPDKLNLFALVGLAWAMKKLLEGEDKFIAQDWVTFILAGLIGTAIGGILVINVSLKRMLYQKDIVTLAIREREETAKASS